MNLKETKAHLDALPLSRALWWFIENREEATERQLIFYLQKRVENTPTKRTYLLGMTDAGAEQLELKNGAARLKFLSKRDPSFEDWYQLDVRADGSIEFSSAPMGEDAFDCIEEKP